MKKIFLATVALVAVGTAPVLAADMAAAPMAYTKAPPMVAPIYNWGGFYVGINGGGGSSHNCWDFERTVGTVTGPEGCHNATGGTVGGQIGYRWQSAGWVFGLEAQGNWADFKGNNNSTFFSSDINQTNVRSFGLFTGQIGYAWNNVLWYVKGGGAVTSDRYNVTTVVGSPVATASESRWGGTVGTGIEIGFAPNWSIAFEYDHLFMGSRDITFNSQLSSSSSVGGDRIRQDVDVGTVRINYTFGGPALARY